MMIEKIIRPLEIGDYHKDFIGLLSQLTITPNICFQKFESILLSFNKDHLVFVMEEAEKIIASGTIIFDQKFTRNGGIVAHIEDIVVHKDFRKKALGSRMMLFLINLAKKKKCYKIMLDCSSDLVIFYMKMGFKESSRHMVIYT